jgi:dimeric dUTPase (all-alpha-NTP-PPase superfamily)
MSICYSIGIERDDGDFHILATLNNMDELVSTEDFEALLKSTVEFLQKATDEPILALQRQDAPDYINLHEDDTE